MTSQTSGHTPLGMPLFEKEAEDLAALWREASLEDISRYMKVSTEKAIEVQQLYKVWSPDTHVKLPAIDGFRGDIYSGLQVASWSTADRAYAHKYLIILSGLYGALRACDGILPYRLEMGYRRPNGESMYKFWGNKLSRAIAPKASQLVNLSAVEYTKALLPYISQEVITPKFMTISPKTGEPTFVTVHAKIARGAFARWLIINRVDSPEKLIGFSDLDYKYDKGLSTPWEPVFVCKKFKGLGLSVRKQ